MIIAFQVKEYNPPPPQPIKIFVKTEILYYIILAKPDCIRCDAEARQERQWLKRRTKYNVIDKVGAHSRGIPK
jgi:hypothetical protein